MFSKALFALLAALAINAQTISTPVSPPDRRPMSLRPKADELGCCHPMSYVSHRIEFERSILISEPARFAVSGGTAPYIV
jgi:hypothetical protein